MSCDCDLLLFPAPLAIPAGLARLDRQIAAFPQWRTAMLAAIGREPALDRWRARESHDLGLMLAEMWAIVCDGVSFYDGAIAHESYLRTARLAPSVRRLVGALGYVPRPAVSAQVLLAALADGRRPVTLPPGTAFRSDAFDGQPPQVFESRAPATLHPLNNRWPIARVRATTLGTGSGNVALGELRADPASVRLRVGDLVLLAAGSTRAARRVASVDEERSAAGDRFMRIAFDTSITLPASTAVASVSLWTPRARAGVWSLGNIGTDANAIDTAGGGIVLDGLHRGFAAGQDVILQSGATLQAAVVSSAGEVLRTLLAGQKSVLYAADGTTKNGEIATPNITVQVTRLVLTGAIAGAPTAATLAVHHTLVPAARLVAPPRQTLEPGDPIRLEGAFEAAPVPPAGLLFVDADGRGVQAAGQLDVASRVVTLTGAVDWPAPLVAPVTLHGNSVAASRGETVRDEAIGVGDGAQARQAMTLAKKPLTYVAGSNGALVSSLEVWVDGVRWSEVPSFYAQPAEARLYIVRELDDGTVTVTFGDGRNGARLPTGARVVAHYRHGAGAATPPAGAVSQLARPVPGLNSVRNPLAAYGGADREEPRAMAAYAPRSALLLGRAVSVADYEAAAVAWPGVRAASAAWRYSAASQLPLVHVFFIGAPALVPGLRARLIELSDGQTPIEVVAATGDATRLDLDLAIAAGHDHDTVLNRVRDVLFAPVDPAGSGGLLRPERLGIGQPLYESVLVAEASAVDGVEAVRALRLDGAPLASYGVQPAPGHYFDFEAGAVVLNGRSHHV